MPLPNLQGPVNSFSQDVTLRTEVFSGLINGSPGPVSILDESIKATIQEASITQLNALNIDVKNRVLQVHTTTPVTFKQKIVYDGVEYLIISVNFYDRYGYYEAMAARDKR